MSPKDKDIIDPEILSISEERALAERGKRAPQIATPNSSVPFGNLINRIHIKSYTEVVRAEEELFGALKSHQMGLDDLLTVGDDIAEARARKTISREIAEEERDSYRRRRAGRNRQETNEELRLQVEEAELKKRLRELNEEKPQEKTRLQKHEEKLDEDNQRDLMEFDKRKKLRQDALKKMEDEKTEFVLEFLGDRKMRDLSAEEKRELEDELLRIEDEYNRFLGKK